ncbi:MAG: 4Fe-4S binding protein [Dehalococcoidia bacterium]
MPADFSPILLARAAALLIVVLVATLLLRSRPVTAKIRVGFLIGGVLFFGFLFGQIFTGWLDPNPVQLLRSSLRLIAGTKQPVPMAPRQATALFGGAMLIVLVVIGWVSNKVICGWACQLGLLQDLLHRIPFPKWRAPFWLANTIRGIAFAGLLLGLLVAGMDWIGWIDPFQLFRIEFTRAIGIFAALLLIASLFTYRPWCQFLCPFGFVSWLAEQFSLLRPRINWKMCKKWQLCVKACPTRAMADFYRGRKLHADCFACGACIAACPQKEALLLQKS